jgi:hypothetical protein
MKPNIKERVKWKRICEADKVLQGNCRASEEEGKRTIHNIRRNYDRNLDL